MELRLMRVYLIFNMEIINYDYDYDDGNEDHV